jgi:hypothetical protein
LYTLDLKPGRTTDSETVCSEFYDNEMRGKMPGMKDFKSVKQDGNSQTCAEEIGSGEFKGNVWVLQIQICSTKLQVLKIS